MNESEIDKLAQKIHSMIEDESTPDKMTPGEATYYYESLMTWLEGSLAGLEDDGME